MFEVLDGVFVFQTHDQLKAFVKANDTYTRHGDIYIGKITFIDSLNICFMSRKAYENWDRLGRPLDFQISLF